MIRALAHGGKHRIWSSARPDPSSILLVPFADGIGDFVNMLPIIRAVRERYPNSRLTVVASQHARHLLTDSSINLVTPSWLRRESDPRLARWRWLLSQRLVASASWFGLRIELGRFDLTINLFKAWEHGVPFARDWTPQVPSRPGAVHTLDFLADHLAVWDVHLPLASRAPRLATRPEARAWAADAWERLSIGDRPVVGLVPASNMMIKQWPISAWARLNDALRRRGLQTVLFIPSPEHPYARLLTLTEHPPVPITTDLPRVAAALERCRLVIGVDTGLLHMAAALGISYVGLFGPTNPDMTGPYDRTDGICVVAPFAKIRQCGGCWKSFKYEDDRCHALSQGSCIGALDVSAVLRIVEALLSRKAAVANASPSGQSVRVRDRE